MKFFSKALSVIIAVLMLISVTTVGMSAYAVSNDIIGDYDFTIKSTYENIDWSTINTYKAATHVHTVRSDGDVELNDMIREYYRLGYDGLALTDHGTVNYSWTDGGHRLTIFEYQYFIHGNVDELSDAENTAIMTGTAIPKGSTTPRGYGMTDVPFGNELNGSSSNKCHINNFYADAGHGDLEINTSWPESAVVKSYNANGFTHINHVGEWAGGNDSALVYNSAWLDRFTSIFENYCPNRENWSNGERGVIGMELVNTADSRTWNDRRYVYDEILKRLAPQGINVYGFCQDDAHEYSDCDRNAQYFLMQSNSNTQLSNVTISGKTLTVGQNNIRKCMLNGEFYTSSKNSKNSYELGNGFVSKGVYPSVSNIEVDDAKNQIIITAKDATKARLVADGVIIETKKVSAAGDTIIFDLNSYEDKINSYVRVYFTGDGGITYLQPFLVEKEPNTQFTLQFITPSTDTEVKVYNSQGSLITSEYLDNYYILSAGNYSYTAKRNGYLTKTESFTITQNEVDNGIQKKINVTLEEDSDVTYAYFYAPETIYLSASDSTTFQYYIDRANAVNGALSSQANKTTGNIFFYREGAKNISISYSMQSGAANLEQVLVANTTAAGDTLSTQVLSGRLNHSISTGEYVLIKWTVTYTYKNATHYSYAYSYVYKPLSGSTGSLAAGGSATVTKNILEWPHSKMNLTASVYAYGLHSIETSKTVGYKFSPYSGYTYQQSADTRVTGTGYSWTSGESGSSQHVSVTGEVGYVYADRSRVNNFSQIPNFAIGFDLNNVDSVKGYDTNVGANLYFGDKSVSTNCLLHFDCTGATHDISKRYNTSQDMSVTSTTHGGNYLSEHNGERVYLADNKSSSTALNYPLGSASTDEAQFPLSGYTKGHKEGRSVSVTATVYISVINVNKNDLRAKLNDVIKLSYQEYWFASVEDWLTYQAAIIEAAKVLGNPASDTDEIADATRRLDDALNSVNLKTGTAVVKHYWSFGSGSGLIYSEQSVTYTYNDNLAANAVEISGYQFANRFECYANGDLIESGTTSFDKASAAADSYEWRFYYVPTSYAASYTTGTGEPFSPSSGSGALTNYGQDYIITDNYPTRTGYIFDGWYLDVADKTFSSGETIKWNYQHDGVFTAQWKALTYDVTYDSNGGNTFTPPASALKATYGDTYSIPSTLPTKTGYNFAGWKLNDGDSYTAGSQFLWSIASSGTLVAQWVNSKYTVTFDPVDSSATVTPATKQVEYDKAYGTLAQANRTGYTATWYSNPSYTSSSLVTASTIVNIASNHTLYAKWAPTQYSISYDLGGGAVTGTNPEAYTIETASFTLKNPIKTGYNFIGWSGTDIATTQYATSVSVPVGSYGNRSYTAHWEAIDYPISYTLNGGRNDARNPADYTYTDSVTIYPATKTGYTFTGWTGSGVTNAQQVTIAEGSTGERSYSAGWSIENYTISYDLAGGSETIENPKTYNIESADITLNVPVKTGYTFAGWQSNYYMGTELSVKIPAGSHGNKAFTAVWSNNGYVITYDLAGGSIDSSAPNGYNTGDTLTLVNPTREGYAFAGWIKHDIATGVDSPADMQAGIVSSDFGNKKFIATWTAETYPITYILAGGRIETQITNPTQYTPDSQNITLINPVKAGYAFAGWSGTGIDGVEKNVEIPSGSIGAKSFTANWSAVTYSIKYDLNGGSNTGLATQYTVESAVEIGTPLRTGYSFIGWSQSYEEFTWRSAYVDTQTGYLDTNTSYSDSIISGPITLRAGETYSLSTASPGGISDLRLILFNLDGTFAGTAVTVDYTPSADIIAYVMPYQGHTSQSIIDSVKLCVKDLQLSDYIPLGSTGNVKLTANWAVDVYTLTYDLNGGSLLEENPATYTAESEAFTLNNPTKTGYSFIGWEYDGSINSIETIQKGSTGHRVYTAQWSETIYSISYNLGGGSAVNPVSYTCNTASFTLSNPTRTGYSFSGWSGTGISGVLDSVTIEKGSLGNRVYTATWTPIAYPITYILDGGSNPAANPRTYTIETETFTLAYPTKTGAVFTGWTGTGLDAATQSVVVPKGSTGSRAYTATWSILDYTITYNLNAGTGGESNPTSYSVNSPSITLSRPTKAGYTFAGWSGTGLVGLAEYVTIPTGSTGNRTYTAEWILIDYTITYTLGSSAQLDKENPSSYSVETSTFTLNNPVRAGYIFTGWTGTGLDTATQSVVVSKGSTGNRNYTANWSVDGYEISYALNGGELVAENPVTYTVNSNDITLNNPTRAGYKFTGWSGTGISGTGISDSVTIKSGSTGNRNYEANWELEVYKLSYDLGGGSTSVSNPNTYTYLSAPITLYSPVKAGYIFLGWESDYNDDLMLSVTIDTHSTGDKSFIAKWKLGVYTITYNLDGGVVDGTNPTSYEYSTPTFEIINPTKAGYVFAGWAEEGVNGTFLNISINQGSSGDKAFTATWSESSNIISYNLNGGNVETGSNPNSYVTNSGTITLKNPTRLGYSFAGWSGTGIDGVVKNLTFDTSDGGIMSLNANWTALDYRIAYNLNGGSVSPANPRTYTIEDSLTLNNPTRTGYTFEGWKGTGLDENYTYQTVNIIQGNTGNKSYSAVWSEQIYTITYDYNGGSASQANPNTYTIASQAITLHNPEKSGYTFTGWTGTDYESPSKNAVIRAGSTGNKEFFANFEILNYTITYYGVDGAKFNAGATSYNAQSEEITLATPTKAGYIFQGWRGTGLIGVSKTVKIPTGSSGDRAYTAQWASIDYSVTYDLRGGYVSGENPNNYTVDSSKLTILNPGRAGYTFTGWTQSYENLTWNDGFINLSNGEFGADSSYPNAKYADPIVLRAGVTYSLSGVNSSNVRWRLFSLNGAYMSSQTTQSYTPTEDCIAYILDFNDLGETARGAIKLTVNSNVTSAFIPIGSMGNVTYTANWSSQSYTITYNGLSGATVPENPETYTPEQTFTLLNPTKTGYTFLGWTGTDLLSSSTNVIIALGSSGNRSYSATWKVTQYSISISLNEGVVSSELPTSFTINSSAITLPTPTRPGYRFVGWSGTGINGTVPTLTIPAGETGNRSYEAVWEENTTGYHTISFYGYNNELIQTQSVAIGQAIVPPTPTVVVGYQFDSWSIDVTQAEYINSVDDIAVYAKYVVGPDMYTIVINGESETYTQYSTVTAVAEATSGGSSFSYWIDGSGSIVSYYRSYSFKAHADQILNAVYGASYDKVKAATRITKLEYNELYDWITIYAERSVSSEYTVLQHGIIFTDNAAVAANESSFVIGTSGVNTGSATGRNKSGLYTLSIGSLNKYGDYIYARSYVKVVDSSGTVSTVYSDISQPFYNYHYDPSIYEG